MVITCKGYVDKYGPIQTNASFDPVYMFKVIVGLLVAQKSLSRKEFVTYNNILNTYQYSIYFNLNGKHVRTVNESTDDEDYLNRMHFFSKIFEILGMNGYLKKKGTLFEDSIEIIKNIFSSVPRSSPGKVALQKGQQMVRNGAFWFYELLKTKQDHVRAIYLSTAIDSLLGLKTSDTTKEQKAELVANLIAEDVVFMDAIKKDLLALYSYRNSIIHGEIAISSVYSYSDKKADSNSMVIEKSTLYLRTLLYKKLDLISKSIEKQKS